MFRLDLHCKGIRERDASTHRTPKPCEKKFPHLDILHEMREHGAAVLARFLMKLFFPEPIPKAAHRFNDVTRFAKLFAQPTHVCVDRAGVDNAFVTPDVVE